MLYHVPCCGRTQPQAELYLIDSTTARLHGGIGVGVVEFSLASSVVYRPHLVHRSSPPALGPFVLVADGQKPAQGAAPARNRARPRCSCSCPKIDSQRRDLHRPLLPSVARGNNAQARGNTNAMLPIRPAPHAGRTHAFAGTATRRNPRWVHAPGRAARLSPRTSGFSSPGTEQQQVPVDAAPARRASARSGRRLHQAGG